MNTKQDRDLRLNIIFAVLGQIISLLINLISKNVLRSTLGIEYLGLQGIYGNFCDVFSFAFSGIGTAMLFHLYGAIAREDTPQQTAVFAYFNRFCKKIAAAVLGIGLISSLIILFVVNAQVPALEVVLCYSLYLLAVVIYNRYIFTHYFIIAAQQRYLVTVILSVVDGAALAGELFCLFVLKSYPAFLFCIVLKNIVINLWLKACLKKRYPYVYNTPRELSPGERKNILSDVSDLLVYRVGSVLVNSTDNILTSSIISTAMAGYYSNYQFVVMGVSSLTGSFFEAIVAKIGHIVSTKKQEEQFQSFLIVSVINIGIAGVTTTCLFLLIQDFLGLWMGRDSILPLSVAILSSLNYYLETIHKTIGSYRNSAGIFEKVKKAILLKGLINLLLSIVLGRLIGLLGILAATAVSDLLTMQWYEPYLMYRYFKKPLWYEVLFQLAGLFTTLLCIFSVGFLLQGFSCQSFGMLFFKAAACGVLSLLLYGILGALIWYIYKRKNRSF